MRWHALFFFLAHTATLSCLVMRCFSSCFGRHGYPLVPCHPLSCGVLQSDEGERINGETSDAGEAEGAATRIPPSSRPQDVAEPPAAGQKKAKPQAEPLPPPPAKVCPSCVCEPCLFIGRTLCSFYLFSGSRLLTEVQSSSCERRQKMEMLPYPVARVFRTAKTHDLLCAGRSRQLTALESILIDGFSRSRFV